MKKVYIKCSNCGCIIKATENKDEYKFAELYGYVCDNCRKKEIAQSLIKTSLSVLNAKNYEHACYIVLNQLSTLLNDSKHVVNMKE